MICIYVNITTGAVQPKLIKQTGTKKPTLPWDTQSAPVEYALQRWPDLQNDGVAIVEKVVDQVNHVRRVGDFRLWFKWARPNTTTMNVGELVL